MTTPSPSRMGEPHMSECDIGVMVPSEFENAKITDSWETTLCFASWARPARAVKG